MHVLWWLCWALKSHFGSCDYENCQSVMYLIEDITQCWEDMNFMFSWEEQYCQLFSKQIPFDIDMQRLRLLMAPALIKSKGTSEEGFLYSALNLSYVRFLGVGKCGIKVNNIIYITQLYTSEILCFVKFKA